jgi:uncharacterized membrane protein HdeD (DUF308 family)
MNSDHVERPALSHYWWVVLLRGVLSILFGLLAFAQPGITLLTLILFWGAYALVDGVVAMIAGVKARAWSMALIGVLGIAAGFFTYMNPDITAVVLLYCIGIWAIVRGILEIIAAIEIRKEISNEWLFFLDGVISIIFGAGMLWKPGAGALAMIWMIATFAVIYGVLLIPLAFRLRHVHVDHLHHHGTHSMA